jgi:hypothetical protein
MLHPSLLPRTPLPALVSIPPTQSLGATLDQPLVVVRFDKTKAYRAGEPRLLSAHFSRAANERPKARTLEPSSHGTFAAEAAVSGLIRIGPRLLDVLLDDLLSPAHHAAIVESVAIEQSQDARSDAHIRLHQLAVLVGLPQERRRVVPHGPVGIRTDCLQPVIVRWRHTSHEVSIGLAIAAVNEDAGLGISPDT